MMNLEDLKEPFPVEKIHWRVNSVSEEKGVGMALAYLDARDVMDRLDEVVGMENWDTEMKFSDGRTICSMTISTGQLEGKSEWPKHVTKSNGCGDTDFEGTKGAFSTALKRVGVDFGIGRYLYSCPNWWVEINEYKQFTDGAKKELNKKYSEWVKTLDFSPARRLSEHTQALFNCHGSVVAIKEGIASQTLSEASEAWFELDDEVKSALWLAPSKGGIFTTEEIKVMKSTEFREANQ